MHELWNSDVFLSSRLSFFSFFLCLNSATHLKEFVSHRAQRWYYHAKTCPDFSSRETTRHSEFLQFGRDNGRFSNGSTNARPRDQKGREGKTRERYGRKWRNERNFHRDTITDVSRVPRGPRPSSDRADTFRLTVRRRYYTRSTCGNREEKKPWVRNILHVVTCNCVIKGLSVIKIYTSVTTYRNKKPYKGITEFNSSSERCNETDRLPSGVHRRRTTGCYLIRDNWYLSPAYSSNYLTIKLRNVPCSTWPISTARKENRSPFLGRREMRKKRRQRGKKNEKKKRLKSGRVWTERKTWGKKSKGEKARRTI